MRRVPLAIPLPREAWIVIWLVAGAPLGVKSAHKNPTSLPAEHSCLNTMDSQNSSKVLTLLQFPDSCDDPPFWFFVLSESSSSRSRRNRPFGSSGKRGTKHLGGASGDRESWCRGCPTDHLLVSRGSVLAPGGKNAIVS